MIRIREMFQSEHRSKQCSLVKKKFKLMSYRKPLHLNASFSEYILYNGALCPAGSIAVDNQVCRK